MWIDSAVKWLLPREEHFFDLLERGADSARKSGALLVQCCEAASGERAQLLAKMIDEEHAADKVIHEVYEALNTTFVTPIDRSDIYALATDLENITDAVRDAVMQFEEHAIDELPEGAVDLARLVERACDEIAAAVKLLRGMKKLDEVRGRCKAINALEHDGDQIFRARIGAMFRDEKDAIRLLKNKELLEGLERALDACDDVANAMEALVIKHA